MSDCCENKSCAIEAMKVNQSKTLKIVLAINVFLFIVVFSSGLIAQSTGLMSESLDDLGDAIKKNTIDLVTEKFTSIFKQLGNIFDDGLVKPFTALFDGLGNIFT